VLVNSYWIAVNDYFKGLNHTYMSLFSNAVFTLFVLILLNLLIGKLSSRLSLRNADLLVIYVMVVMVSTISGHRMSRFMGPIVHPVWMATPANDWRSLIWGYIPHWFTVWDEGVLGGFFRGESSLFTWRHMRAWIGLLAYWSAFLFALCFLLLCVNAILRRQFSERERLTYPITWLPLAMGRRSRGVPQGPDHVDRLRHRCGHWNTEWHERVLPVAACASGRLAGDPVPNEAMELHRSDARLLSAVCDRTCLLHAARPGVLGVVLLLREDGCAVDRAIDDRRARAVSG